MAGLNCNKFIEEDKNGTILYTGARWNEGSGMGAFGKFFVYAVCIGGGLFFLFLMILINANTGDDEGRYAFISGFFNLCFIAAIAMCVYVGYSTGKVTVIELRFYNDGSIESRKGAKPKDIRRWGKSWTYNTISFEALGEADRRDWHVDIVSTEGDTVRLSAWFWREEARKIVVTLNEALKTIRATDLSTYSTGDEDDELSVHDPSVISIGKV